MKSSIFIPKKINVGFQSRENTYTKKLAYIIYYDEKGKLRKETSWNNWRNNTIPNEEFENEPTSGFVLNKKAGGYSSGWNHRQTYVRVFDPRGFEFEIDVPNLLYILENTNSIKGKGLEGEFVYGWDGTELVLTPTESPDYKEISQYNKAMHNRVKLKGKDMKIGGTYLTKDNKELIYLGRFDYWDTDWNAARKTDILGYGYYPAITKEKRYFFYNREGGKYHKFETIKVLSSKLIGIISEECVGDYANLMDELEHDNSYSPEDRSKDELVEYTVEEFHKYLTDWYRSIHTKDKEKVEVSSKDSKFFYIKRNPKWSNSYGNKEPHSIKHEFESIEKLYEFVKPVYLKVYLENGKLYREEKY